MDLKVRGEVYSHHHYKRFIELNTELWTFGTGLGDVALMEQIGEAFHDYIQTHGDPALGNIMMSIGLTATSVHPYEGDFNVWWAWGSEDFIAEYLKETTVTPSHVLAPSRIIERLFLECGVKPLYLPLGVGKAFHPLHRVRQGLGYAGDPIRPQEQRDAIVSPIIGRRDFEWHAKSADDEWFTLERLNEWYNSKCIVFGMSNPYALRYGLVSNRFYETWASGTPLITYTNPALDELFPHYPYQSSTAACTVELVDGILGDYARHHEYFIKLSELVRKEHSMLGRIERLMEWLKK